MDKRGQPFCTDHHELVGDVKIIKYMLGVKDKTNGERDKQIEELKKKAEAIEEHSLSEYKTLAEKIDSIYTESKYQKGIREGHNETATDYEKNRDRLLTMMFLIIAGISLVVTIANYKGWI